MTTTLEIIAEKCDLLLTENEELRERVMQLEALLTGGYDEMPFGGLTRTEAIVLRTIASHEDGAPKTKIFDVIYAMRTSREVPEPKIIDALVCKIRRKLSARGIVIETVWGWGYRLPPESREVLEQLRAALS